MIAIFPEIAICAAARDVERLAVLVRKYFGGDDTTKPKPDVASLLKHAGVRVDRLAMQGHGALLATDENGRFSITAIIGAAVDPLAERFLLAHMLGHYLLDVQPLVARGDWQASGFREAVCPMRRYGGESGALQPGFMEKRELLADHFAAALLMPMGMVRKAHAKLKDETRTAAFFGVDRAALMRRLRDLDVAPNAPVNFLDAEQRAFGAATVQMEAEEMTLSAPPEAAMPRSVAASAYGQTEKTSRATAKIIKQSPTLAANPAVPSPAQTSATVAGAAADGDKMLRGMERIRALARKIESEKA